MNSSLVTLIMEEGRLKAGPQYVTRVKDFLNMREMVNPVEEEHTVYTADGTPHKATVLVEESAGMKFYYIRLEDYTGLGAAK